MLSPLAAVGAGTSPSGTAQLNHLLRTLRLWPGDRPSINGTLAGITQILESSAM